MNFVILTDPFIENYKKYWEVFDMAKLTFNNKEIKAPNIVTMPIAMAGVMAMMGVVCGTVMGVIYDCDHIVRKIIKKMKK